MNQLKPQTQKVLNYFKSGRELNAAQAEGLFGVKNLRARVAELREEGYAVYTNRKPDGRHTAYRLGTPSKDMVAAAYFFLGDGAFR